jgi:hypothetical protein
MPAGDDIVAVRPCGTGLKSRAVPGYAPTMAKADRLAQLDLRRAEMEAEYVSALVAALTTTASGKWGLFDHQGDRSARARVAPIVENLNEIAQAIDNMRDRLAMPPFDLHREFLASRGPVRSDALGEPKQARAWLDRLAAGAIAGA